MRLNPSKTLVIWLGGKHQVPFDSVPILSSTVSTVESARDLGVVLDSQLTMHVCSRQLCLPISVLSATSAMTGRALVVG